MVLMDLFSDDHRISGGITYIPVLVDKIRKYPDCNRIIFGVNSNKEPAPVLVKKMLLVLTSANILRHNATVGTNDKDSTSTPVVIKAVLAHSRSRVVGGMIQYALFDDIYWNRVRILHNTGV